VRIHRGCCLSERFLKVFAFDCSADVVQGRCVRNNLRVERGPRPDFAFLRFFVSILPDTCVLLDRQTLTFVSSDLSKPLPRREELHRQNHVICRFNL